MYAVIKVKIFTKLKMIGSPNNLFNLLEKNVFKNVLVFSNIILSYEYLTLSDGSLGILT